MKLLTKKTINQMFNERMAPLKQKKEDLMAETIKITTSKSLTTKERGEKLQKNNNSIIKIEAEIKDLRDMKTDFNTSTKKGDEISG